MMYPQIERKTKMKLQMTAPETLVNYRSRSQIARVITEAWARSNLYCAACDENTLIPASNNTRAFDFECGKCSARYQLKSSRKAHRYRIVDSAYSSMREAIESDHVPNLLALHYSEQWSVINLLLIPSFCFSVSALEKRKPLAATAKRAGWVGCNILLNAIPPDARIQVVSDSTSFARENVRTQYRQVKELKSLPPTVRGWTLDVLTFARSLGQKKFTLRDMYTFETQLATLYPSNRNIRPKIRQQLQVLRDIGFLQFTSRAEYEFV
jgi:type II restriction enzyme